jgi:hypothetical protein
MSELRWDIRNDSPTCELALPPAPLESADHGHETAGIRLKIDDQAGVEYCLCLSDAKTDARKALCARSEKVLSDLLVLLLYKHGRDG